MEINEDPPVKLLKVEIKALVRHRDGYVCTDCGMTAAEHFEKTGRNLDVHRVVPGSKYAVKGCVSLCRKCHGSKPKTNSPGKSKEYINQLAGHLRDVRAKIAASQIHQIRKELAERSTGDI